MLHYLGKAKEKTTCQGLQNNNMGCDSGLCDILGEGGVVSLSSLYGSILLCCVQPSAQIPISHLDSHLNPRVGKKKLIASEYFSEVVQSE